MWNNFAPEPNRQKCQLTKICLFGKLRGMDALSAYLDERRETLSAFAVRIGRSPSTLSRTLAGERLPSVRLALDVENGTERRVRAVEFIEACLRATEAAE